VALSQGETLGPYEIIAPLGAGGMGEIYRARDQRLRREVAIKVLQAESVDPVAADRLLREARTASALNHPHICAIYDVGETHGRPFVVMELLDGSTLRNYLVEQRIDTATAVTIGIQIAEALEAAHGKGVVHRDIKPSNVVVSRTGHVKVLDFGLAKQIVALAADETRSNDHLTHGVTFGTPQYMPPEVWQGRAADVRSDIWALGIVLYEMLVGRVPFDRSNTVETAAAIIQEPLPALPLGISSSVRAIIERCLAKDPDARYQRAGDVGDALRAARETTASAPADTRVSWKWVAGAAAVLLLTAGRDSLRPV